MRRFLQLLVGVSILVVCSPVSGSGGPLTPASFNEYVGISLSGAGGTTLSLPELVTLSVSNAETANLGSGTGSARASGILPVAAETELHLLGGLSISGIGGTTFVKKRCQFMIQELQPGPPQLVDVAFEAWGRVSVDSNQPVGSTFVRLTLPFGHFEARNWDAGIGDAVRPDPLRLQSRPGGRIQLLLQFARFSGCGCPPRRPDDRLHAHRRPQPRHRGAEGARTRNRRRSVCWQWAWERWAPAACKGGADSSEARPVIAGIIDAATARHL